MARNAFLIGLLLMAGSLPAAEFEWDEKGASGVATSFSTPARHTPFYKIGPGDSLTVFVWRHPDLSMSIPVRPDGRISIPLVEDLQASGNTPTELARMIEKSLAVYVKDPLVTVIVSQFNGPYDQRIRVIGEAAEPQALAYRDQITVLDVMIAVGGLTDYASGNNAKIVRQQGRKQIILEVRLDDLIKDGDISANVAMLPGDILIVPESWF